MLKKPKLLPRKNIIKAFIFRYKIPIWVCINLTNRCHNQCKFCGIWGRLDNEMTTKQIFSLIDEIVEIGTRVIGLTGGEPLLREDIIEIISYAKRKKLDVHISSSGQLIPEKISILKYIDFLQLSFDGPKEIHDSQRYEGGYNDFIRTMKLAKARGINLYTLTVLTKNNIDSIEFILNVAQENKFYAFFQPLDKTFFWETPSPELKLSDEELRNVIKKLIMLKRENKYIGNSLTGLQFLLRGDKRYKCFAGKYFVYVHTNGDIYPCWTPPNIKVLNYGEVGFKNAFYKMPEFFCSHCLCASTIEHNYLSLLNFDALFNYYKIF